MPTLKDTEWRVLCIVVRQTLGWQEKNGARRTRDWLTQSQLKRRAGRNTEALSKAITALTAANLLEVRDGYDGAILDSSAARRRHRGKLYFGLSPGVLSRLRMPSTRAYRSRPLQKAVVTPRTPAMVGDKMIGNRTVGAKPENDGIISKNRQAIPVSELRNPNTTKETATKENITKENVAFFPSVAIPRRNALITPMHDSARIIQAYLQGFHQHVNQPEVPKTSDETKRNIENLLLEYGHEQLETLLEVFFVSDVGYFKQQGYSLETFAVSIPILKLLRSKNGHFRSKRPPS